MSYKELFEIFDTRGQLLLPDTEVAFTELPWRQHPTFDGVELKHIVTAKQSGGQFSYHLVRIAPNKKIGNHVHLQQLETHEVICGRGVCINNGCNLDYQAGVISIFPANQPHEIIAGAEGLYLFAKFIPALN